MNFVAGQAAQLLDLARYVIQDRLGDHAPDRPPVDDPAFDIHAGCFVTLHTLSTHHLRGCIGMIRGTMPLRDCVEDMSEAVLRDPRFYSDPVTLLELPRLDLEITVLSPLQQAADTMDFDLQEHGIYLSVGEESGCFLPQVARETGWTRIQLLARLCHEKMGLDPAAWKRPDARLFRFTAQIVGPEPFVNPPGPAA